MLFTYLPKILNIGVGRRLALNNDVDEIDFPPQISLYMYIQLYVGIVLLILN